MSTSTSAVRPTRRTLVRGAAWSVPVVALAATAPTFAASVANSSLTAGVPVKWGSGGQVKHVSWDLTLTNGAIAIQSVLIGFSYLPNGSGSFSQFTMGGYNPTDTTWSAVVNPSPTAPYTVTATHGGIPANATRNVHIDFSGADASKGEVSASATITYVGGAVETKTLGPVGWDPGNQHSHVGVTTP